MKLKDLFSAIEFSGCVTLCLVEEGVEYLAYDGYGSVTERKCDGALPQAFAEYADCEVKRVRASRELFAKGTPDEDGKYRAETVNCITVDVLAKPKNDICEIFNTGGNIFCGVCRFGKEWFFGGVNSWGCFYKTYSEAIESYCDTADGFVRYVSDKAELKKIWTHIYAECLSRGSEPYKDFIKKLLETLDEDLEANLEGDLAEMGVNAR